MRRCSRGVRLKNTRIRVSASSTLGDCGVVVSARLRYKRSAEATVLRHVGRVGPKRTTTILNDGCLNVVVPLPNLRGVVVAKLADRGNGIVAILVDGAGSPGTLERSEEHPSELQSLMRF